MIRQMLLCFAFLLSAHPAFAQDAACTLYTVDTSLLNISKEPGGTIYNDALFDGETACVTRLASVNGADWGFVAYKLEGATRSPVDGWSSLQYLKPVARAAAGTPLPNAPAASAPAAPSATAPAQTAAAPPAVIRPEDALRFRQPIPFGPFPVNGKALEDLMDVVPLFSPLEGLDEVLWKKNCTTCHQWNQARLCEQGSTYVQAPRNVLRVPHPFGGALKIALMRWAKSGCQ